MVKTLQNTMGSLVNSVKPMAHTHSSFFFSNKEFTHCCNQKKETLRSLVPISQSTCDLPTTGSHSEATSIIKAGVFTGAEN